MLLPAPILWLAGKLSNLTGYATKELPCPYFMLADKGWVCAYRNCAMTPEEKARDKIDSMLAATGWLIEDYAGCAPAAAGGVAVREYPLKSGYRADYLLFINRTAVGVIEAKAEGTTLSGGIQQAARYRASLPDGLKRFANVPFSYASTGVETYFCDVRDPDANSRRVFTFHTPDTLSRRAVEPRTLRERLKADLPPLEKGSLRACQFEAITQLEVSLKESRPRALIQMATGSGKTHAAVTAAYRLIQFAGVKRVLFLVDRRNLGRQTLNEFENYTTSDDGRRFTELYNVQHLSSNVIDEATAVCITTIQRLYAMLKGETTYETDAEEASAFEHEDEQTLEVAYNPSIPMDTFDVIIVDECHRSIYGKWQHVLTYFDAFIIGLTATPYRQTVGFFDHNLVYEYRHEEAVADDVNVGYYVYQIQTEITRSGGVVGAGHYVARREKESRRLHWDELDADVEYTGHQLDRDVVAVDQIRKVIQTFKDKLFSDLFPSRGIVPKTLIFAKDDTHAEDIVGIVREVFAKGDAFCQKITYQSDRPEDLIRSFRTQLNPRIVVSVDMISTGTDIKPLECLVFMRVVRSSGYFEQMIGRGVRVISRDDLRAVTGDAVGKTHFIVVDAVGVIESVKTDSQPLSDAPPPADASDVPRRDPDQLIDDISEDRVIGAGFDDQSFTQVAAVLHAFKAFINENVAELSALQILCRVPGASGRLSEGNLKTLEEALQGHSNSLSREAVWLAYKRRYPENVRGDTEQRMDLISLVRYAVGENGFLEPFRQTVNRRFVEWLHGKNITDEQREWLGMIRDHIATSLDIRRSDFEDPPFVELGNGAKIYELFGEGLDALLKDLTESLVS